MSSYSDSSDSDVSRRRRGKPPPPPPPFGRNKPKPSKKKKKRQEKPQETIDKIWSRFQAPRFSKATKILPFAAPSAKSSSKPLQDATPPPPPSPQNLLVSEDFERAVLECRTKVQKLIKECKRVNMRYRDPLFDIDWDLKWEKGYCLNGLGDDRFEVSGRALMNPSSLGPKAVKRVHEIFNKPTFLKEKVKPADVKQGSLGDCWLMASLTALANMEVGIQRICVEYDTKIGIYGFVFHRDGEWIISIIDDKLYLKSPDWDSPSVHRHLLEQTDREDVEKEYRKTYQTGSQSLFFAHCRDQNETWLPLLEKAYAKAHGDYAALSGGWIGEGVEDLTGGVTTELLTSDILDIDDFWENEIVKVNKEFLFGCSTGHLDGGYGNRDGISEGHAYVIMEARQLSSGQRLLKLRNPWGKGKKGNWEGPWSDGSKEFTPEAQKELNHKFGNDSVFWISYQDLLRKYQHFDRTRLFMDCPDWRITQKWISVEVPWKAEFEQKFRIVLKKESPVVLVLSQLDERYFEGLQGQYRFRLQFRLHEVDSPGEEDYIVRSHGNYLMNRSVVTELKSLAAGTYQVFIMVVADRDINLSSVEDVVKQETRKRVDNEKLAQVGAAYDLAHSKGALHITSRVAARKAKDKAEARKARIKARRTQWEKRHIGRDALRKQAKKNAEKRERKNAKDESESEEIESKDQGIQTEDITEVKVEMSDKAMQTEDPSPPVSEPASESATITINTEVINERDKAVQTDDMSASVAGSQATPITPKTGMGSPRSPRSFPAGFVMPGYGPPRQPQPPPGYYARRPSPPRGSFSRGPPAIPMPMQQRNYVTSEGESSASPVDEYADMYSDDEMTLKHNRPPGPSGPNDPKARTKDSDDEDDPEPWNAVCIVGFRVYSKDEGLELTVFEEGDEEGTDGDVEDTADDEKKKDGVKSENEDDKRTETKVVMKDEETKKRDAQNGSTDTTAQTPQETKEMETQTTPALDEPEPKTALDEKMSDKPIEKNESETQNIPTTGKPETTITTNEKADKNKLIETQTTQITEKPAEHPVTNENNQPTEKEAPLETQTTSPLEQAETNHSTSEKESAEGLNAVDVPPSKL